MNIVINYFFYSCKKFYLINQLASSNEKKIVNLLQVLKFFIKILILTSFLIKKKKNTKVVLKNLKTFVAKILALSKNPLYTAS